MRSAIMDIGYNAIRAVVYEDESLGAPVIFSNKFKSDILSLLTNDSLDIKHQTYLSIQYFLYIFKKLEVSNINCVATAVLRNHPRAEHFIQYIRTKYNFNINVISGEQEARLTAIGLISGIKDCNGIAADLGGGSLELIEINNNTIGSVQSFELGTKVISSRNIKDEKEIIEIIKEKYYNQPYENLYMIGGALRFIARIYIDFVQYPLKNLHNLEIPTEEFSEYLTKLQMPHASTNSKLGKRKINSNAIFVAKALIEIFNPQKIIISTYGLKEGVRFESMTMQEQQKDIVLEKVKYTCNFDSGKTDFGSYFKIVAPLISKGAKLEEMLQLAIILLSLKNKFDTTLHAAAISEFILSSEIPFTHKMRIMLALTLAYATNYKPNAELMRVSRKLLSKEEHNNSQIIGHFLCIAEEVDGPNFSSPSFSINIQNYYLEIDGTEVLPRPIFEKICTRLKLIAFARRVDE